jgi:GNAT superfamily N-acetyltransferase
MDIRRLDPDRHWGAVRDFYDGAADYVLLECGAEPDEATVLDFFEGVPPGGDLAASYKLGLFTVEGRLAGIADLGFGFPERRDAYIGLMLLDPAFRGAGLGRVFLDRMVTLARQRDAPRLLVAVLDDNPRARAFWERNGFRVVLTTAPVVRGRRMHVFHRMERRLLEISPG